MNHHLDRGFADEILNDIQNGFRLGVDPEATYTLMSRNIQSASLYQDVIGEYLKQEIELGNILGPFQKTITPVVYVNRFGVILKGSDGKVAADH